MLDASTISGVLDAYRPERLHLLDLLGSLPPGGWLRPTECPLYTVKGVAAHLLGDDMSLLSRQRDGAQPGTSVLGEELPRVEFRQLLDAFNDQWVTATQFFSPELLQQLLRVTGEWTAAYYEAVDPAAPAESVALFGAPQGGSSPFWQAIAREYLERWIHHSQIRRALALASLAEREFLVPGVEIAAAIARVEPGIPESPDGVWALGPLSLGSAQQTADILTRAHPAREVRRIVDGPDEFVALFAQATGRP